MLRGELVMILKGEEMGLRAGLQARLGIEIRSGFVI